MISIIVPVYNAEQCLNRCVDSILLQTYSDFEVLLIDDGSKDASGRICDEYALRDDRIRVFHKENGGVSSARNLGLEHARGEWITFCDADDYLPENNLFLHVNQCENAQIHFFSMIGIHNGERREIQLPNRLMDDAESIHSFLYDYLDSEILKCICGKFVRKDVAKGLLFDELIRLGEDTLFFLSCVERSTIMASHSLAGYAYITKSDGRSKYSQGAESSIYAMSRIWDVYRRLQIREPHFECNLYFSMKSVCEEEIQVSPKVWYGNSSVSLIYHAIKENISFKQRLYYFLQNHVPYLLKKRKDVHQWISKTMKN